MNISDEAVEAAAKGLYERKQGPFVAWADTDKTTRRAFMGDARTALEAAAPHLLAVAWDEGKDAVWSFMSNADPRRDRPSNPYRNDAA